jgi:hypothetical protein
MKNLQYLAYEELSKGALLTLDGRYQGGVLKNTKAL